MRLAAAPPPAQIEAEGLSVYLELREGRWSIAQGADYNCDYFGQHHNPHDRNVQQNKKYEGGNQRCGYGEARYL